MRLLNILKKSSKYEKKLDEAIEVLNDIFKAIQEYSENEDLLESYHHLRKDIYNINLARLELENSLLRNKLSQNDDYEELCYGNKYKLSTVKNEMETSILEALSATSLLIENYKKLYIGCDKLTKKKLMEGYYNCLKYLNKAKSLLLDKDSVNKYIFDREVKLQEKIENNLRNEYNIKVDNSINSLIEKLDKCNNGLLLDLTEIITMVGERKVEDVYIILKKLNKRVEFIDILISVLKNNNSIENKNEIIDDLILIENNNNENKFNIDLVRYDSKVLLMDFQLNKSINPEDFKKTVDKIRRNCENIKEGLKNVDIKLKENYHIDKYIDLDEKNSNNKLFNIDTYIRYYYYDKEDIEREWDNYEEILEGIDKMQIFEQNGYCFKYTKSGMILASKTQENVKIEFACDYKYIKINGKKKYINLNKRFEVDNLTNHTRVTTIIEEIHDYIMCVFYINNLDSEKFINELEKIKSSQKK